MRRGGGYGFYGGRVFLVFRRSGLGFSVRSVFVGLSGLVFGYCCWRELDGRVLNFY